MEVFRGRHICGICHHLFDYRDTSIEGLKMKSIFQQLQYPPADFDLFYAKSAELYSFLCSENEKNNLTRIVDEEDYWIKHVYDSLLLTEAFPEITKKGINIADLGCGAGFPSLILAAGFPEINITGIDSIGKKTTFVEKAGELLTLKNLEVINGRGRELAAREEFQKRFDYITARAVSDVKTVFREVRRMLKPSGKIILYKTPKTAEQEICELRKKSSGTDFEWVSTNSFSLPNGKGERLFVSGKPVN